MVLRPTLIPGGKNYILKARTTITFKLTKTRNLANRNSYFRQVIPTLAYILTFLSGSATGTLSDMLSGTLAGILSGILLVMLFGILYLDILSGMEAGILSDILSGI